MMFEDRFMKIRKGDSPLIVTAIHDGHDVRDEVKKLMILPDPDRLREEDPYTGSWTKISHSTVVVKASRFQVDLNRPRDRAVYINPEDAWGLNVWNRRPPDDMIARSLEEYDNFYAEVKKFLTEIERQYKKFIVFDLHTYNHLRDGADGQPADPSLNPEVNIGTGTMDRDYWAPVVDRFMSDLRSFDFLGRKLDVRENIKFKGGQFSRWVHENFPRSGCSIAIEFKKFFMNEWTGELDMEHSIAIKNSLASVAVGVMDELKSFKSQAS